MHCRQRVCMPHMIEYGFVNPTVHKYNFFQSSRKVLHYCQLKLDKSIRTPSLNAVQRPNVQAALKQVPGDDALCLEIYVLFASGP